MTEFKFEVAPSIGRMAANFDEVAHGYEEIIKKYDGIVFTEETKTDAKKEVANLRKEKKKIEDAYKQVKKIWMEPLEQFKLRVDDLLGKIDVPIDHINGQVEAFEQKRLADRNKEIQEIYDETIGDMAEFLPLYLIRDEKWTNAGKTVKAVRKEMSEAIANARAGKAAIENMRSDAVPDALKKFRSTLNLADALNYINQYEDQKAEVLRREEERRKQEQEQGHQAEIERIRSEERRRIAQEEQIRQEARKQTMEEVGKVDMERVGPLAMPGSKRAVYTVVGTDEELQELEMAMDSLGLYFERKDI